VTSAIRWTARWSWAGLLAIVVGAGCSGSKLTPSTDGAAGTDGAGDDDFIRWADGAGDGDSAETNCALLDESACAADPSCRPIEVEAVVADESCLLPPVAGGCAPRACNGPTLRADDGFNQEFVVLGGCLPSELFFSPSSGSTALPACSLCEPLSIAQCKAVPHCQVIQARPIDDLRSCILPAQDVACALFNLSCTFDSTRATDPAGKVWSVPSACVPPGWSAVGGTVDLPDCVVPTGPETCDSLSVRDCPLDTSCRLLSAKPTNSQGSCALPTQPVGCIRADATCADAITRARDTNQGSWTFPSTCLPTDWTNITSTTTPVPDCPSADGG